MTDYTSPNLTILMGDADERLRGLPDNSIQCTVTSPPYYQLRSYGVEGQIGLEETPALYVSRLARVFKELYRVTRPNGLCFLNIGDTYASDTKGSGGTKSGMLQTKGSDNFQAFTPVKIKHGLKPKDLMGIPFRVAFALQGFAVISIAEIAGLCAAIDNRDTPALDAFREGFRLWEELGTIGWYLRRDIIWHKPNPLPSSATDRPGTAHEYVFMLAKSQRYYFDMDAIKEPIAEESIKRNQSGWAGNEERGYVAGKQNNLSKFLGSDAAKAQTHRNSRSVWTLPTSPFPGSHFATMPMRLAERCTLAGTSARGECPECGAAWERVTEKRTSIPQRVGGDGNWIKNAHESAGQEARAGGFYDMESSTIGWRPTCECYGAIPELPEYPDKPQGAVAGWACEACEGSGVDFEQAMSLPPMTNEERIEFWKSPAADDCVCPACKGNPTRQASPEYAEWVAVCSVVKKERTRIMAQLAEYSTVPQVVLDPFGGAGTTAKAAISNGRRALLIELNPEYAEMAISRVDGAQVGLNL